VETLTRDRVTNLAELFRLVAQYREYFSDTNPEDIYLDATFEVVADTLTDGSKVFDIHVTEED
jgi:hypothetical protein